MRFKLTLDVNKRAFGNIIPINYQYEQSAVIYKILSRADASFSKWLHENGYQLENGKRFKLFTYSRFEVDEYRIHKKAQQFEILSDAISWQISFLPEKGTEKFIQGLFMNQIFEIGNKDSVVQFIVKNIEIVSPPEYAEEMHFQTLSPICVKSRREDGSTEYLSLADNRAKGSILYSLMAKYRAFYGKPYIGNLNFDIELLSQPKPALITLKANTPQQTKVKGFLCNIKLKAPIDLIQIAYPSLLGEEFIQGFCCSGMNIK